MITKNCRYCDKEFTTIYVNRQIYCSFNCQQKYNNEKNNKKRKERNKKREIRILKKYGVDIDDEMP
jgi:hypothetical protein